MDPQIGICKKPLDMLVSLSPSTVCTSDKSAIGGFSRAMSPCAAAANTLPSEMR